jgi:type II secretory ATPase GspE/PulE/Tfp pilus assembly ATPase PilB-like protein
MRRANASAVASGALAEGELSILKMDGYAKVRKGATTLEEVAGALVM